MTVSTCIKTSANRPQEWLQNGQRHRDTGPAVVYSNGDQGFYQHGHLHRLDGPAVIHMDGYLAWFVHGLRHRLDGPAVVYPDGTQEWWLDGTRTPDLSAHARMHHHRAVMAKIPNPPAR